jgi:cell division septation protein DedD
MAWSHPPEVKAAVRKMVEETTLTFAAIAAATGVPRSTVSDWTVRHGWTRPDGAFTRRPLPKAEHAAAGRILGCGVCHRDLALVMHRDPDVVRRWRPPGAAAAGDGTAADVGASLLPAQAAALHEALTAGPIGRDEFLRRTPEALALVMAETVIAKLNPDRKAQALAHLTATAARMPAEAPARGASPDDASPHDDHDGPGTYDETNALLEEFALRLAAFDAAEQARGLLGDAAAADAPEPA